jgi:hypothetical protein
MLPSDHVVQTASIGLGGDPGSWPSVGIPVGYIGSSSGFLRRPMSAMTKQRSQ